MMDWLYDIAQPFVWHPARAFAVALVWLVAAFILPKSARRPLFIAAAAWGVFALLEFAAWWERADIRVDLLVTWPALCVLTVGCVFVAVKRIVTRGPREAA